MEEWIKKLDASEATAIRLSKLANKPIAEVMPVYMLFEALKDMDIAEDKGYDAIVNLYGMPGGFNDKEVVIVNNQYVLGNTAEDPTYDVIEGKFTQDKPKPYMTVILHLAAIEADIRAKIGA